MLLDHLDLNIDKIYTTTELFGMQARCVFNYTPECVLNSLNDLKAAIENLVRKGEVSFVTDDIHSNRIVYVDYVVETRKFVCNFASAMVMDIALKALVRAQREKLWEVILSMNRVDNRIGKMLFKGFVRKLFNDGFQGQFKYLFDTKSVQSTKISVPQCGSCFFKNRTCGGIELFLDDTKAYFIGSPLEATTNLICTPEGRFCPTIDDIVVIPSRSSGICDIVFVQSTVRNTHKMSSKSFFSMLMFVKQILSKIQKTNISFFFVVPSENFRSFECPLASILRLLFRNISISVVGVNEKENIGLSLGVAFPLEKEKYVFTTDSFSSTNLRFCEEISNYYWNDTINTNIEFPKINAEFPKTSNKEKKKSKVLRYETIVKSFSAPFKMKTTLIDASFCFGNVYFYKDNVPSLTWGGFDLKSFFKHMVPVDIFLDEELKIISEKCMNIRTTTNNQPVLDDLGFDKKTNVSISMTQPKSASAKSSTNNIKEDVPWFEIYKFYHNAFYKKKYSGEKKGVGSSSGYVTIEVPFAKSYNKFEICEILASWRILFSDLEVLFENDRYFYLRISVVPTHAKSLIQMLIGMGYDIFDTIVDVVNVVPFRRHFVNVCLSSLIKKK
jgi:hypothetical protein